MSALDKAVEVRMLSDVEMAVVEQLREARAEKKSWEEQETRCRAALLDAVGSADVLMHDGNIVSNIERRTSRRWNRKLFAKDWPKFDAMEEYNSITESTVINLVGGPGEVA